MDTKPKLYLAISSRDGEYNSRIQRIAQEAGWQVVFPSDKTRSRGSADPIVEESLQCQNGLVIWSSASIHSRFLRRIARRLAAQGRGISLIFDNVSTPKDCHLTREVMGENSEAFWRELEDLLRYEAQQDFSLFLGGEASQAKSTKKKSPSEGAKKKHSHRQSKTHKASKTKWGRVLMPFVVVAALAGILLVTNWLASGRLHELAFDEATRGYPELFPDAQQAGGNSKPVIIEY